MPTLFSILAIVAAVLIAGAFQACLLLIDTCPRRSAAWWTLVAFSAAIIVGAVLFMSDLQLWVAVAVLFVPRVLWWVSAFVVGMRLSWWMASGNTHRLAKVARYVAAALKKAEEHAGEHDDQGDDEARDTSSTAEAASRTS